MGNSKSKVGKLNTEFKFNWFMTNNVYDKIRCANHKSIDIEKFINALEQYEEYYVSSFEPKYEEQYDEYLYYHGSASECCCLCGLGILIKAFFGCASIIQATVKGFKFCKVTVKHEHVLEVLEHMRYRKKHFPLNFNFKKENARRIKNNEAPLTEQEWSRKLLQEVLKKDKKEIVENQLIGPLADRRNLPNLVEEFYEEDLLPWQNDNHHEEDSDDEN